jgi:pyruvate,water dikinase
MTEVQWEPPGPGPWQQDSAHNPVSQTLIMREVYPEGFNRGFEETFAAFGVLLDRLAMGSVNGFTYHQPQPFDLPGPDGPKDPEWIHAEFGRRAGVAEEALAGKIWREVMERWDGELKPASQARHRELGAVDIAALDDGELLAHLDAGLDQLRAMVYQHHRFNAHALVPVGDFLLHAAGWLRRPPMALLPVFDGYSPVSSVSPPEMRAALAALRADDGARELLESSAPAAEVLAALRARVPAIDNYVADVHFRVLDGFDVVNPTIGERPESIIGRLRAALDLDADAARARGDAFAAELREVVPEEHRAEFDELLIEARLVYRLRDERGLFSEISAIGVVRLALLELGRRLSERGRLHEPVDVLDVRPSEIRALVDSDADPSADELRDRRTRRIELTLAGPPRFLGPPPPPSPPADGLPPALGRVMSAIGFLIDGVLGQLEAPQGDAGTIGGIPGATGVYEGIARRIHSSDELLDLEPGEVIVAPTTGEAFNSVLHLVGAMVTDHGSFASHAAIVSREMGIPAVVGTVDGTRRIRTGDRVRVDGTAGKVTLLP